MITLVCNIALGISIFATVVVFVYAIVGGVSHGWEYNRDKSNYLTRKDRLAFDDLYIDTRRSLESLEQITAHQGRTLLKLQDDLEQAKLNIAATTSMLHSHISACTLNKVYGKKFSKVPTRRRK